MASAPGYDVGRHRKNPVCPASPKGPAWGELLESLYGGPASWPGGSFGCDSSLRSGLPARVKETHLPSSLAVPLNSARPTQPSPYTTRAHGRFIGFGGDRFPRRKPPRIQGIAHLSRSSSTAAELREGRVTGADLERTHIRINLPEKRPEGFLTGSCSHGPAERSGK